MKSAVSARLTACAALASYETTQKQRQVEASLRKVKRELIAAKRRGDDEKNVEAAQLLTL